MSAIQETPRMQPDVLTTPLPVDQGPSDLGNLSQDIVRGHSRRNVLKLGAAGLATSLSFAATGVSAQDSENPQTAVLIESDCIPLADTGTVPGQEPTNLISEVRLSNGDTVVFEPDTNPDLIASPLESPKPEEEERLAQLSGEITEEEIEDQIAKDLEAAANADESQILTDEPTTDNSTNQDVEINPEEVLVEEDTDTTIECPPGMIPNPNSNYSETEDNEPAPDSIKTLLENDIDKKAKFSEVERIINKMYATDEYKNALKRLRPWPGNDYKIKKEDLLDRIGQCRDEEVLAFRRDYCVSYIENFIQYAQQQYPLGSGDSIDAEINSKFVKAASVLRSAAANDGIPANSLNKRIRIDAEELGIH